MRTLPLLMLMYLVLYAPTTLAGEPELSINPLSFSEDGELTLSVRWDASEEITIWAWKGKIYPLLGRCLTASATTPAGRVLDLESVELVTPKFPTQRHAVRSSSFVYDEPLKLRVLQPDGSVYQGCLQIQLHYDLSGKCRSTFENQGFDILNVKSDFATACNAAG